MVTSVRTATNQNVLLVGGLAIALGVLFQEPIQDLVQARRGTTKSVPQPGCRGRRQDRSSDDCRQLIRIDAPVGAVGEASLLVLPRSQCECHLPLDDNRPIDSGASLELSHSAPQALDRGLDDNRVTRMDWMQIADFLDTEKVDQTLPVHGLGEDENCANLRDSLGQNGRWQNRALTRPVRKIAFVERNILDADDPPVLFELGDLVDEEKRVAMGEDLLNRRVVEREGEIRGHGSV